MTAPQDRTSARGWSLSALSHAIEGAAVLIGEDGEVVFATADAARLLGAGDDFDERWAWIHQTIDGAVDLERLVAEGRWTLDVELPEGARVRTLHVRLLPVTDDEQSGYLAILKDRAALDALQSDLRRAAQMKRVTSMMAQAAHDLRAPLNALTLNIDLVRQLVAREAEPERIEQRLTVLDDEVRRLDRMLQVLLAQGAAPREVTRRFDLRRLVRELVALLRPQARGAGITFRIDLPTEAVTVLGVRDHLKQALLNLVMNGIEAMPDGGDLAIRVELAEDVARLVVADTGPGILPAARDNLFKLHFTTKKDGSGIGLFTARATVHALGGTLALESEPGAGTHAIVTLPLDGLRPAQEIACSTS